jgi:hypothetical protein
MSSRSVFTLRRLAGCLLLVASAHARAFAQGNGDSANHTPGGPVLLIGADYARHTHLTGTAGLVIPVGDQKKFITGDVVQARQGLEFAASAGTGGFQFAGGYCAIERQDDAALFYGADVRGVFGTLRADGLSPRTTYVGADASYTFVHVRGSLGLARRLNGDSSRSRWMFAASIGILIPLGGGW